METYFLTNASLRVVATDYLVITNHFLHIFQRLLPVSFSLPSHGNVFLNKSFIPATAIGEGFSLLRRPSNLFESFCHLHEWKPVSEGRPYSWVVMEANFLASGNYFLPWSQIFFKDSFIPVSANPYFRLKEKVLFTQSFLYLLVETIIYFIYSRVPNNHPLPDCQFFNFFLLRTSSLPPPPPAPPLPLLLIFSHFCSHL